MVPSDSRADMDAVGAAVGVCCAARKLGRRAQIVIDAEHSAAGASRIKTYFLSFLSLLFSFELPEGGFAPSAKIAKGASAGVDKSHVLIVEVDDFEVGDVLASSVNLEGP